LLLSQVSLGEVISLVAVFVKFASVQMSKLKLVQEKMLKEVVVIQKWIEKLQITNPGIQKKDDTVRS
jgi:hypothetical protein